MLSPTYLLVNSQKKGEQWVSEHEGLGFSETKLLWSNKRKVNYKILEQNIRHTGRKPWGYESLTGPISKFVGVGQDRRKNGASQGQDSSQEFWRKI